MHPVRPGMGDPMLFGSSTARSMSSLPTGMNSPIRAAVTRL